MQSMGRTGSPHNAVIESWHSTLEFELRSLEHFSARTQAQLRIAAWIEQYNHDRLHPSPGMACPVDCERVLTQQAGTPAGSAEREHAA